MLIKVIYTSISQVPDMPRILENERTDYGLRKDNMLYGVYGMKLIRNRVDYFVCRTGDEPRFLPSWFFEIQDQRLPSEWCACNVVYNNDYHPLYKNYGISFLVGYSDLVATPLHYDGILDRDETELRKFFRIKNKIDLELYGRVI